MQDLQIDGPSTVSVRVRASRLFARAPEGVRRRAVPFLLAGLGALTFMPALRTPRFLDDYIHTLMIDGRFPVTRSPFNLYDFVGDAERADFIARGFVPWWAHPAFKLRFLRPLSSSLMWFEQRVLALGIGMQHLHSFAWWLVCVLAARALFRRVLAERPALLATLAFAFAPCHSIPLAWIANRNALLSLAFGILALCFQLDWRGIALGPEGAPRARARAWRGVAACGLFSLALLSGEYALCFGGYVLAFELMQRGDAWWRRLLGLVPFAAPALGYLLARHSLGYGTVGSGFYVDPLADPLAFLRVAPLRLASLLAQGWLTLGTDTWFVAKLEREWLALPACALAAAVFTPVLRRVYAHAPSAARTHAAWLLLGSLFATLPVLSAVPSPRLMGVALLGIAAQVALILDYAWFPALDVPRSRSFERIGLCASLLGFFHFVHGPVTASLAAAQMERSANLFVTDVAWVGKRLKALHTSQVVVVRGGVDAFFGPFALVVEGGPWTRWDVLSDPGHLLVLRKDKQTLDLISPSNDSLSPSGGFSLFRHGDSSPQRGDEYRGADFRLRVLAVGKFGPTRARVRFREPIGREKLWLSRQDQRLYETPPPEIGFGMPSDR